jgi:hypothetical protein
MTRGTRTIDDIVGELEEARAPRQTREEEKRVQSWAPGAR